MAGLIWLAMAILAVVSAYAKGRVDERRKWMVDDSITGC